MDARFPSLIIVLGMHRSGTSALSNMISAMGGDQGKSVMSGDIHNQGGYGENTAICAFHDSHLAARGSHWKDPGPIPLSSERVFTPEEEAKLLKIMREEFDGARPVLIKDPRMCRLLPEWNSFLPKIAEKISCVLISRHPWEVTDSLVKRDKLSREWGLLLWLQHTLEAELHTRGGKRISTNYPELLSAPETLAARLAAFLELGAPPGSKSLKIDPSLHRSVVPDTWADNNLSPLQRLAMDVYHQGIAELPYGDQEATDRLRLRFYEIQTFLPPEFSTLIRSEELLKKAELSLLKAKGALKDRESDLKKMRRSVDEWNHKAWYRRALHKLRL